MDPKLFQPPVLIGERVLWLGSGSGVPQSGYVRWIGRLPEMGPGWTLGLELDNPLPYGGIDGTWGNRHLFTCETKHGLLVPATKTMKESTLIQPNQENGLKYVKPNKCIPETPFEAVSKFCPTADLVTCDIPRPAVRRKKHVLLQQTEQERPIAPKRKTKLLAKQSLLPKIYETSPTPPARTFPRALSSSSLNDCGTIKSLESHTTFNSFPASHGTLKSSVSIYGTLKSSISECDISKYSLSASLCSLASFSTLRTCRSDEYSDYQWFDAKDKCEDIFKCKYHSLEKGDTDIKNKCHIIEGQQIRLIESKYCRHIDIKTPHQNVVNFERMNGIKRQKKVCEDDDNDDSSYEDATSTIEQTYSESGSCPRKDKTTSGFFSFLRWFKKNKESADERNETLENDCNAKQATVHSSPEFVRNVSSSCGSIDTIFSTATVNSFAFVAPTFYRPFGYANPVEKGIIIEPETDTYRNRIVHRDRVRELDKNLTLRKKYHLYSSDTLLRTTPETSPYLYRKNTEVKANAHASENIHVLTKKNNEVKNQSTNTESHVKPLLSGGTSERKKRRAPDPPTSALRDNTLSNSLDSRSKNTSNATDNEGQINVKRTRHRRTVSDSAKDKKAGAFCHVKGKRKAPLPPTKLEATSSLGRKKRPAPQPPQEPRQERRSTIGYLTPEEKERLIANIDKLRAHAEKKIMEQASAEQVICNDSLRLEKGVLRPNKDITKTDSDTNSEKKTAPVSPRPWYKRSITSKDSVSGLRKDIFKSLEKKKEHEKEKTEEWMPEVGFPRITSTGTNNRFSIFSRSEEKKAEGEKRKSQISMLANISELDREAAEIVQKEQAREQALIAAEDAKFYSYTEEVPMMGYGLPNGPSMPSENVEVPKRSSARELISLFNAIGNVTKVTVNSTFFSKEEIKKRFSFMSENVKTVEQTITVEEKAFEQKSASSRQSLVIDFNSPSSHRKRFENVTNFQTSPEVSAGDGVTITEIKEQAPTKPRTFQSPNPCIPTITEQSESATATPASTPGDVTKTVVKHTSEIPQALSHAKRITIWSCPRCTLENPSWKITCEACGSWRPTFSERPHNGLPLPSNTNSSSLFPDNTKITDLSAEVKSSVASATVDKTKTEDPDSEHETSPKQVAISGTSFEHEKPAKEINSVIKPQNKFEDNKCTDFNKQATASMIVTNEKEVIMNKYLGKSSVPKNSLNPQIDNNISKSEEENKKKIFKDDKSISASNFKKESIKEEKTATISDIQKEETVNLDEVRMARLAFFNNAETHNVDTNTDKPDTEKQKTIHDADERARLKEMLKEMKNSLPKRPNKLNAGASNKDISNDVKKHENDEGRKLGAIKKLIHKPQETTSQIPASDNKSTDINALLITTKTVYDDIKVKRSSSSKSSKVSTSVQTNAAVVQKILQDDSEKKKNTKTRGKRSPAEVIVPITVQEFSGSGIKDGVLYTSLKKDSRRLGKGTFELIHAKDFANIEATKTGSENTAVHVYANLPPTSPVAHSPFPVQLKQEAKTSNSVISDDSKSMQVPLPRPDTSEVEKLTAQLTFQKGIDDFKADLKASPPEKGMNTLAINRLLRRLEMAIVNGEHNQAAILAKDLAKLKINCSVIRQRQSSTNPSSITVDMYVEDKISHQGPIPLQVVPTMTVGLLKQKVQKEFEIPAGVQRWILGKQLASDDSKTLADHNINTTGCPLFLYLVAPDGEQDGNVDTVEKKQAVENAEKPTENHEMANRAGGWFYNDEEDRYSFCEDTESSEEEQPEEELKEVVKEVTSPMLAHAIVDENSDDDDDDDEEEEDEEEVEEEETEEENELENAAAVVVIHEKPVVLQAPVVAVPFVPPKLAILTGKENTPQAGKVEDNIAGPPRREAEKSSTLKLGWKCPICTLVNSPTRPGCAACTTERPQNYIIPKEYEANDRERLRLRQEQTLDNELQQARDEEKRKEAEKQQQSYLQLINLDKEDLVPNAELFDCSVCLTQYNIGEGVVLRECLHTFCRLCLINTVQFSEEAEVKCPYRDADYACASALQEREIKALVPREVYEQHLAKSVAQAENKIGNAFHCKTPDCRGWCIFEDNVNEFKCPVCRSTNCLTCQAIHDGMNCKQYQEQMNQESETNADARRTKEMLEEMVERGEAMNCPTCQVVLMKKWGCDWLRCSMCKTEICWVTRGPRWGPGGKGDTSGGCQCGLNGIKCHPRCNYCH